MAECWQLKPEALGLTPGGTTFVSSPLLFQRSMDSITAQIVSWIRHDHSRSSHHRRVSVHWIPPCCDSAHDTDRDSAEEEESTLYMLDHNYLAWTLYMLDHNYVAS